MQTTIGQFNVKSKDLANNYTKMVELIKKAKTDGYEMIVFGEYALTGYGCGENFNQASFYTEVEYYTEKLKALSDEIIIIFGSIKQSEDNNYVVATILDDKSVSYTYKENLVKREFDEKRYFKSKNSQSIILNGKNTLITFNDDYNQVDSTKFDQVIILASNPVNQTLVSMQDNIVYANTVGITNVAKTVFINGGNSFINRGNKTYAFTDALASGIISEENVSKVISKLEALVKGIKVFSLENFGENKQWLLGSSGGLDSAVTLSLLSIALGSENVISYNMRSQYNSDKTISNAKHLAEKLNIRHHEGSIEPAVNSYLEVLAEFGYTDIPTLAFENIQARTRGHLLGGFSSLENAIICNNGNKMEYMLGYATLYGDTIGALAVIGDLKKVEVFELAKEINEYFNDEVIPKNLLPTIEYASELSLTFETYPSAELKDNQSDPMKWFYHDELLELYFIYSYTELLEMYLTNQFEGLAINEWLKYYNLDNGKAFVEDLNWFVRTIQINSFKRNQMPPILAYSNRLINVDYAETLLLKVKSDYDLELEEKIINTYK